ncbi:hypothetical protein PTKIN_Ptkin17bG0152500 [Pterospermum kingtungense]
MFLLLFLFTSIEVELPITPNGISFRIDGGFSIAFTSSFLASIFFPPSIFWAVYLLIVLSSRWHALFFDIFKHFFQSFSGVLPSGTCVVRFITGNEESSGPVLLQEDIELGLIHQQEQGELSL